MGIEEDTEKEFKEVLEQTSECLDKYDEEDYDWNFFKERLVKRYGQLTAALKEIYKKEFENCLEIIKGVGGYKLKKATKLV